MVRPHGLRGEVVVELVSNRPERTRAGVSLSSDAGPMRVTAVRPFGDRWLMRLEGVDDREAADRLRGVVLRGPAIDDAGALWVHELVGAAVVRAGDGAELGRVRAVVANPASDLLELEDGRLVPVRFVVRVGDGRVAVDPPDGLLEL